MAKLCPFNYTDNPFCNSDCALFIDDECAITNIAKSFRQREMLHAFMSRMSNMKYGSTYGLSDKFSMEGYENENT